MKNYLIAAVIVLLLVGGGILFFRYKRAVLHFHSDSIVELEWAAGEQHYILARASPTQPWDPPAPMETIDNKLKAFANANLEKIKPFERGEVTVTVGFGGKNRWTGIYHAGDFIWTEGFKKGYGFHADAEWRKLFEEGRFAFQTLEWNICPSRPQKIVVKLEKSEIEIENVQQSWSRKVNGKPAPLEAAVMKKWFNRNCIFKVEHFRDLGVFPVGSESKSGSLLMIYPDGHELIWTLFGDVWEIQPGRSGLVSAQLTTALRELR